MVDGIYMLMHSDLEGPTNIGSSQYVTVDELVETVIEVAGKEIHKKYVEGPVGVQARNPSTLRQSSGQAALRTRLRAPLQQGAHSLARVGAQSFPQRGSLPHVSLDRSRGEGVAGA